MAINALYIFKAFLSNQLLRLILRQFIARYLFKYFLDLIGTPIYMLFNALNSHLVYGNIIATIMGKQIISIYTKDLHSLELNEAEKELIYDALHLVVVSKKERIAGIGQLRDGIGSIELEDTATARQGPSCLRPSNVTDGGRN